MTGMLLSMWKSGTATAGLCCLPVTQLSTGAVYHWEITSIDHDLEWRGKPGLFFCLLSSLQRIFSTENIPLQVRTLAQGVEVVKGGLGEVCEVCWEAGRRGYEQVSTKQKRITAWRGKSCQSCPFHYRMKLLPTT